MSQQIAVFQQSTAHPRRRARWSSPTRPAVLLACLSLAALPAACQVAEPDDAEPDDAVAGTLSVPVFLWQFSNTSDSVPLTDPSAIARMFDEDNPGSVSAYYQTLSGGRLRITAHTDSAWRQAGSPAARYSDMQQMVRGVVRSAQQDTLFDWGVYDNDGPDDEPNSGDDDGVVDVVLIVLPELGAECARRVSPTSDFNSSRRSLTLDGGAPFATHTRSMRTGGSPSVSTDSMIVVNEIILMAGQGGDGLCTPGEPPPIAPVAHELGHILGIPELYDNHDPPGPGIARWGLMGLGGLQTPSAPVSMTAWPLTQLGWVEEIQISSDAVIEVEPVEVARKVYRVSLPGTTEYLLLSNRQPVGVDANLTVRSPFGGELAAGLLVWHVDSLTMWKRGFDQTSCWKTRASMCRGDGTHRNQVNSGAHHGLVLESPDGYVASRPVPFNAYDSTLAYPEMALGQEGAAFTYPGFVSISVLGEAPEAATGTLRVDVDFLDGSILRLGDLDLPDGKVGEVYKGSVSATGAEGATWRVDEGSFPEGLTMAATGEVTGTPAPGTGGTISPVTLIAEAGGATLRTHVSVTIANP